VKDSGLSPFKKPNLNTAQARRALKAIETGIMAALANNEDVILEHFGVFAVYDSPSRNGINPQTQQPLTVPAQKRIRFRWAKSFRKYISA
jgi:DNA-binding protein HU-beta